MKKELFDFGFTAVDETELEAAQQLENVSSEAERSQEKLDELYNAIQPLLANLKMNPEKEYILWPDRLDKIEQFEEYILKIYKGN
jgi:hypothetical protein